MMRGGCAGSYVSLPASAPVTKRSARLPRRKAFETKRTIPIAGSSRFIHLPTPIPDSFQPAQPPHAYTGDTCRGAITTDAGEHALLGKSVDCGAREDIVRTLNKNHCAEGAPEHLG